MIHRFYNKQDSQEGFTLVETLVAIGILITAVAAPLTIAHVGLRAAHRAQDALTAQMLAMEAIEFMRNMRDTNYLQGDNWDKDMRVGNPNPFTIDPFNVTSGDRGIRGCQGGDCQTFFLTYNKNSKVYRYKNGPDWERSIYSRAIEVDSINSNEILVTATVWWTRRGEVRSYTAREYLLNWYD